MKTSLSMTLTAGALGALVFLSSEDASAQAVPVTPVSPDAKGTVGGALLGGEIVITVIGAAGVRAWWPYLVFGGLGSVAGGVGGWALETDPAALGTRSAELSVGLLAGGLVLLIPSIVVMVNALSQPPPEVIQQQQDKVDPSKKEPEKKQSRTRLFPGGAMLGVVKGQAMPGIPAMQVGPLHTPKQMQTFGVDQGVEVKVPVFETRF